MKKEKWQVRCEDCPCLNIKKGVMYCTECFNQLCSEIDDCPEGVTAEQIEEITEKTKKVKIKMGAKAETQKKEKKPKERKPDLEKEELIQKMAIFLENHAKNVKITNISKIIEFEIGENHYKIDLIRQRKPKK